MTENQQQPTITNMACTMAAIQVMAARAFESIVRQMAAVAAAMRPLLDYYEQHPEEFAALQDAPPIESCHCFCEAAHGGLGVCEGEAEPGLTIVRHSPTVGTRRIPVCRPCHDAALTAAR